MKRQLFREIGFEILVFVITICVLNQVYSESRSDLWIRSWINALPVLEGRAGVEHAWTLAGLPLTAPNQFADVLMTILSLSLGTPRIAIALFGALTMLTVYKYCFRERYSVRGQIVVAILIGWGVMFRLSAPAEIWNLFFGSLALFNLSITTRYSALVYALVTLLWSFAGPGAWLMFPATLIKCAANRKDRHSFRLNLVTSILSILALLVVRGFSYQSSVQTFTPDFHDVPHLAVLLALVLAGALSGSVKAPASLWVFLGVSIAFMLLNVSMAPVFVLSAALFLGSAGRLPARKRLAMEASLAERTKFLPLFGRITVYGFLLSLVLGYAALTPIPAPIIFQPEIQPLFATLRSKFSDVGTMRLFNHPRLGDVLTWYGIPPFIDERTPLYQSVALNESEGRSLQKEFETLAYVEPGWRDVLQRLKINAVITERETSLASVLLKEKEFVVAAESIPWEQESPQGSKTVTTLLFVRDVSDG